LEAELHPDHMWTEIDPVINAIMGIPATTVAGLAVKARFAKLIASPLWDEAPKDMDADTHALRRVVEAVLEAANRQAA